MHCAISPLFMHQRDALFYSYSNQIEKSRYDDWVGQLHLFSPFANGTVIVRAWLHKPFSKSHHIFGQQAPVQRKISENQLVFIIHNVIHNLRSINTDSKLFCDFLVQVDWLDVDAKPSATDFYSFNLNHSFHLPFNEIMQRFK